MYLLVCAKFRKNYLWPLMMQKGVQGCPRGVDEPCSAPYWLEPRSGKFLRHTGTNRLQKGTIRVSVLSS